MVIAVAMVGVTPGCERSVYYSLKNKDGILDIFHIFGEYDFFMILQADGLIELSQMIDNVHAMHGIAGVRTILVGWDSGLQNPRANEAST